MFVRRPYLATLHRFSGLSSYKQIVSQARMFDRQQPLLIKDQNLLLKIDVLSDMCCQKRY